MNRQLNFLIDTDKEKKLFDYIENRLNCKLFPYFITEDISISEEVFLIVPYEYEKDIKYVDINENMKGKKICPFDEWINMIPAIEYSRENVDYYDSILCRIYLNYGNIRAEGKKKIKYIFDHITYFIKKHSKKLRVDGMLVYRL